MSIQGKMFACLSTLILMAATGVSKAESVAETHIVLTSGTISSIFSAIGLANEGDTISIDIGICKERIVVDVSIKLISTDRLSIDGKGKEPQWRIIPVFFYDLTGLDQNKWILSQWRLENEGR